MRRTLAVSVLATLVVAVAGKAGSGQGLIAFSSDRSPLFTDHLIEYFPNAPPGARVRTLAIGSGPAWSPDGRRIAFVRGGPANVQLYVMNADGSGVRQLTHEPSGQSAIAPFAQISWSPDGARIAYFEYGPVAELLELSTGKTVSFSTREIAWSPDGRRIAYGDTSMAQSPFVVANVDGTGSRTIANVGQNYEPGIQWSPDGSELLFTSSSASGYWDLFVVSPDGTGLRQLTNDPNYDHFASWSPDGRRIAFFRASSGDSSRGWLTLIGANGGREHALARVRIDSGFEGPPAWSKDGKRIGFGISHGGILITSAGGGPNRVFDWRWPPRAFSGAPSWRPGRDELLFSVHLTTSDKDIYVARPDGSGVRALTRNEANDDDPSWSPDGRRLAVARTGGPRIDGIWVISVDGGGEHRLTTNRSDATPAWSPDGRRIAFVRNAQLWLMRADGSGQHRVLDHEAFPGLISWSPDGRWIAFADGFIYVVAPDGSGLRHVTGPGDPYGITPAWSPDGTRIAFATFGALLTVSADGTGLMTIFKGESSHPSWSPDGLRIAFQTVGAIDVMNADGSAVEQIVDRTSLNEHPAWGPAATG
jgi:Tol biopolymer transport system component